MRHRPLLHAVRDGVRDDRVEGLEAVDRAPQVLEDRLGEVLALGALVEDVGAVDLLRRPAPCSSGCEATLWFAMVWIAVLRAVM